MLDVLKLVYGAVGSRTLLDILTTFHIYGGRIQAQNGRVTIDAECEGLKGVELTVDAERFYAAVTACAGQPKFDIDGNSIVVKKGRFRAKLQVKDKTQFPRHKLEDAQTTVQLKKGAAFLAALQRLRPFVSEDASRPWSMGVLFLGGYAYATNNVVMARVPIEFKHKRAALIPVFAVDELLRVSVPPLTLRLLPEAMLFTYPAFWVRSQLISEAAWPDVEGMFTSQWPRKVPELPAEFKDAVESVAQFVPDEKYPVVLMDAAGVKTMEGEYQAEVGGIKLPEAAFRVEPLRLMLAHATHVNFSTYPAACAWQGAEGLEGFIIGVRR